MKYLILALFALAVPAGAQTVTTSPTETPTDPPTAAADGPVRVGIVDRPPFAMVDAAGTSTGLAVDLLRLAADELRLDTRFEAVPRGDVPAALASGARIVLPVEAAPDLSERVGLTMPVYTATLGAAAAEDSRIMAVLRGLASWRFVTTIAGLSLLLLAVGAVVWAIERRRNSEMFHESPTRGLGDGFWWAGVTLTTIGYGDKAPATFWGRAVAMLWMLVGLAVSASLTATIVALSETGQSSLSLPGDLRGRTVAAVEDSIAAAYAQRQDLRATLFPDAAAAVAAVAAGEADVALGSAPTLRWAARDTDLVVATTQIDPVLIVFALAQDDPLLPRMNAALLRIIASEAGQETIRRYLPDG